MPPRRNNNNNNTNTTPTPILTFHNQHLPTTLQQAPFDRRNRLRRAVPWYRRGEDVWRSRLETTSHIGICLAAIITLIHFLRRRDAE
ncbi:hypothetical protein COCMIDRAFT_33338 [Bipolaris oryzae ATCC 44560]|uniref:Uncharacterized protein n=1 Tax=Bipolaris oryzae ATCC 44560 TaxID=930090 RepID=W6ZHA2_COCMI|nr:uncharacterized protein COCMIDRAFT_33338 [Bipolaris oryzae ATCC 44560]EUC49283.1 hypothetical protein COCMIDRAFT_33338 [Bipolaris oryzae ATCC 44560]